MASVKSHVSKISARLHEGVESLRKKNDDGVPEGVSKKHETEPLQVDTRISPNFTEIGRRSSYFFLTDSSHYLKRHVETLQIKSASHGRRRLTIDVQLPVDRKLGQPRDNGDSVHEFWIPVTFLAKYPSRSNVDVRDDRGRVTPLLTRNESNEISLAAVLAGTEELLGQAPSSFLRALLTELVMYDGMRSEVPLLIIKQALKLEGAKLDEENGRAFIEALRTLTGNYSMWVRFRGRPGERRIVKLHYDIELSWQGVLRQRPTTRRYVVFDRESETEHDLNLKELGDKNPYSPLRRVMARIASSTGLGAVNVGIESPYIVGSDSYHLQVESPPGVETRDIDLLATVEEEAGTNKWSRDHGAHLYVSRTRLVQDSAGLALLTLRIGRRGFMTLAWLSAVLSATLLWLFDLTARKRFESPEATAAVLLFGPALLAALVVRPGEHPVATKLFSGIRLLIALNGILVVAAAAAVAGVRPEGWSAEHTWFIIAIAATVSVAVVSLSWVFSWDTSYKLVKGLRRQLRTGATYRRLCVWLLWLAAFVLLLGSAHSLASILPPAYLLPPLTALTVACWFVAAGYAGLPPASARVAAIVVSLTGLAASAGVATLVMHIAAGWAWEAPWLLLAAVPLTGLLALLINDRRWRRKKRAEAEAVAHASIRPAETRGADSEEPDEGDGQGGIFTTAPPAWLQQTPSGKLVRKQARDKATGIPDLIAPSAYREVIQPGELIPEKEAEKMLKKFREAVMKKEGGNLDGSHNGHRGSGSAEKRAQQHASDSGRELVCLDLSVPPPVLGQSQWVRPLARNRV